MEDIGSMFAKASSFNADISKWNVSNVKNMSFMFSEAIIFNQDISTWDVSKVTNMKEMFEEASAFNNGALEGESAKPLKWDVSKVTNMYGMFYGASSFNADISTFDTWNVSNVKTKNLMFKNSGVAADNLPDWYTTVAS